MRTMPSTVGPVMSSYGPGARRRIMDDLRASAGKKEKKGVNIVRKQNKYVPFTYANYTS